MDRGERIFYLKHISRDIIFLILCSNWFQLMLINSPNQHTSHWPVKRSISVYFFFSSSFRMEDSSIDEMDLIRLFCVSTLIGCVFRYTLRLIDSLHHFNYWLWNEITRSVARVKCEIRERTCEIRWCENEAHIYIDRTWKTRQPQRRFNCFLFLFFHSRKCNAVKLKKW